VAVQAALMDSANSITHIRRRALRTYLAEIPYKIVLLERLDGAKRPAEFVEAHV
jgi:hypothetical protein